MVRSRPALALVTGAAVLWALANALVGLSWVILSGLGMLVTTRDLYDAGNWLKFVAGLAVLVATAYVASRSFLRHEWIAVWEIAGATLATLLFTIGLLIIACASTGASNAGLIVSGVGLGGWAVVLIVVAARRALFEQDSGQRPKQAGLWLAGSAAVLVMAIVFALQGRSLSDATTQIVESAILAAGLLGLLGVLLFARARRLIASKSFPILATGLSVLALANAAAAVSDGIVLPPRSLTSLRVGLSIPAFIAGLAMIILAWAALYRMGELQIARPLVAREETLPSNAALHSALNGHEDLNSNLQPSWRPDPAGVHELRLWDGMNWTEHVSDSGQPSKDPMRV